MELPDCVFVYGTLREGSDHPMARRLAADAEWLGNAYWRGRLYSLGPYPAAVRHAGHLEVRGDLYRFDPAAPLLDALDAYEEVRPERGDWYVREVDQVRREDGQREGAWVYRYTGPVVRSAWIPHGDWLVYTEATPGFADGPPRPPP